MGARHLDVHVWAVKHFDVELEFVLFFDNLQAQFPFGTIAAFDGFEQVAAVEVGILP